MDVLLGRYMNNFLRSWLTVLFCLAASVFGSASAQVNDPVSSVSNYRLAPGDVISIRVLGEEELSREKVRLTDAGTVPMPAIGEEVSLVLPPGFYHAGRELEVMDGNGHRRIRMNHVLNRQADFERISIVEL